MSWQDQARKANPAPAPVVDEEGIDNQIANIGKALQSVKAKAGKMQIDVGREHTQSIKALAAQTAKLQAQQAALAKMVEGIGKPGDLAPLDSSIKSVRHQQHLQSLALNAITAQLEALKPGPEDYTVEDIERGQDGTILRARFRAIKR